MTRSTSLRTFRERDTCLSLAIERNTEIIILCSKLELTLIHGMKVTTPSLGMAVIKNVKDLESNNFGSTEILKV